MKCPSSVQLGKFKLQLITKQAGLLATVKDCVEIPWKFFLELLFLWELQISEMQQEMIIEGVSVQNDKFKTMNMVGLG